MRYVGALGRVVLAAVVFAAGAPTASVAGPPSPTEPIEVVDEPAESTVARVHASLPQAEESACDAAAASKPLAGTPLELLYRDGIVVRPADPANLPFKLRFRGYAQFRHVGFANDVTQWTNHAGVVRPVTSRHDFELERGRFLFDGFLLDPKLGYFVQLDGDTDDAGGAVEVFDCWASYQLGESVRAHLGKGKLPVSREWLASYRDLQVTDRSIATTYFRPDRSVGFWLTGDLGATVHWHAMVGNGLATANLSEVNLDGKFAYALAAWYEPWGPMGTTLSDLEHHQEAVVRLGASVGASRIGDPGRTLVTELDRFRLSDGTLLVHRGAVTPQSQVQQATAWIASFDLGWKYQGWSLTAETFLRSLSDFRGVGTFDRDSFTDAGYFANVGCFVIPRRVELVGRLSQIFGAYGAADQYSACLNWFVFGTTGCRISLSVDWLNGNPAENSGANYRAGDTGLLIQTQLEAGV